MPLTPYHIGPGILIKSLLRTSFSLAIFGWTQILMDLQPLFSILTGIGDLHGISHTYLGAIVIGIISAISGKFFINLASNYDNEIKKIKSTSKITYISAFIGSFSHIVLDSIMHLDMEPFYPFSQENNILHFITINQLHDICIYTGIIGLFFIFCFKRMLKLK